MLGRFIAILTFRRRAAPLTGPAKVIDGDTIVMADQLVRLHGIDAPELDQTFRWRGQQIACGTMSSLSALEALTAGVKVRWEMVERDRRLVAKVFSPNRVDIGRRLVSARSGVPAVLVAAVQLEKTAPSGVTQSRALPRCPTWEVAGVGPATTNSSKFENGLEPMSGLDFVGWYRRTTHRVVSAAPGETAAGSARRPAGPAGRASPRR
jgi:hypothetical protein